MTPTLLDDLLSLAPPAPSREALEKILRQQGQVRVGWIEEHLQVIMDLLMAWSQGETRPRWCEHIVWATGKEEPLLLIGPTPRWILIGATMVSLNAWTVCPLCGTKRPEGR